MKGKMIRLTACLLAAALFGIGIGLAVALIPNWDSFQLLPTMARPETEASDESGAPKEEEAPPEENLPQTADAPELDWYIAPYLLLDDIQPLVSLENGELFIYAPVVRIRQDDKWGLTDYDGRVLLEPAYDHIAWCSCQGGQYVADGYLLDEQFQVTNTPHQGHGAGSQALYWDLNSQQACVLEGGVARFSLSGLPEGPLLVEGLWVEDDGEVERLDVYGYLYGGTLIAAPEYDKARNFSQGLAAVSSGGSWGYINQENDLIIPLDYEPVTGAPLLSADGFLALPGEAVYDASDGYVVVCQKGLFGLFDIRGREIMEPLYEAVRPVREGRAWVKQYGLWGLAIIE